MGALSRLWNLMKNFHAADISSLMNHLVFREKLIIFNVFFEKDKEKTGEVLSELDSEDAAQILKELQLEQISELFQIIPPDDVAPILDLLPDDNVSDAVTAMQLEADVESAFYLYAIDEQNRLVGVVSLRQLLFAPPNTPLENIMTKDVISVHPETDQEQVARNVADYNFVAIPVVDSEDKLIGVVTVDDVIDVIDKEATEDIYKMASLDTTDRIQDSPLKSIKKRLPFLMFSLLTASLAPFVVHYFEDTIKAFVTLAVLMPLVAALGGIAGNQTIAIVVREIAIGQADWISARKALLKEMMVGIGNGIIIGLILAAISYLLMKNPYLGFILGLAIIANLFVAALLGTIIPLFLKLLRLDPALGSVNLLTMCTDTVGFLSLLGLGTLFLSKLV
jgi:magnesium transporter